MSENGILNFPRLLSEAYCKSVIDYTETMFSKGFGRDRQTHDGAKKHEKQDTSLFMSTMDLSGTSLSTEFFSAFWNVAYPAYVREYSMLASINPVHIFEIKVQKTEIGGGFHSWHFEADSRARAHRLLAFTLYLNDVAEGGETEFLYYPRRVKPRTGDLLLFPAGFLHAHRGNPPLSGTKYIATGWVVM